MKKKNKNRIFRLSVFSLWKNEIFPVEPSLCSLRFLEMSWMFVLVLISKRFNLLIQYSIQWFNNTYYQQSTERFPSGKKPGFQLCSIEKV